ncbi:hypothetical protein EMIHUDRAFT_413706 [Emiliania huxleyi CCMP1516]|uniref:SGNH hydrolase-type esterase domain-containing protein n=4 Tax=Emiliania huxleyi TaxID=2903 RepID=A0A0D3IU98_EMIH1|nr:hypothetical protein EMIHUDRAFT_413706 [Emiliania huxleyi CCMP1516]EOD14833.1 hypothetical protein EMIHUDRAFT_413706 [Emiliania huxleyi CCMP1516]|eukprot:XP_005767262.1 hypothetical protein EMIHUDRAFT_413706 [Emiliania huxleyi CCMP1516]
MSVSDLIEKLASTQAALIKALQEEYFCDDVVPPQSAFGWDAEALRAYFESGGETLPANGSGGNGAAAKPAAAAAPPPPRELGPPDTVASGRPIFLALGDSLTEFGQHVCDPTWDKKAPFATDVLQRQGMDIAIPEHGPGWLTLLQRDYSWRTSADVLNRGYSGCNSRLLRASLSEILGSINRQDVFAITLSLGSNDHVSASPGGVPKEEFKENMAAVLSSLQEAMPSAKIILITPGRINKEKWAKHVSSVTNGRLDGAGRGETLTGVVTQGSSGSNSALKQYVALACEAGEAAGLGTAGVNPVKGPRGAVLNLNYMMQYQLANYHEAEHPDGYHFSAKLNRFVYKSVRDTLEGMKLSPVQMPMHRPAPIAEFQSTASKYGPSDDDGRLRRRV